MASSNPDDLLDYLKVAGLNVTKSSKLSVKSMAFKSDYLNPGI